MELVVEITEKARCNIYEDIAYKMAEWTYQKFNGDCEDKFNRYTVGNYRNGEAITILVVFEENTKAIVMTYEEALTVPGLKDKCKERWGEEELFSQA